MRAARTLAALAACAALVAGCGLLPAAPGTLGAADQACNANEITFAIGPDDIGWLLPIIDIWNKANPGTPVQPLYLPTTANGQLAQLVADLQAKSCLYDVTDYAQASLAISGEVYQALQGWETPEQALADMRTQLSLLISGR
jgi:ABC-type glycerol-3-phosphate transport system substrate-binding protein